MYTRNYTKVLDSGFYASLQNVLNEICIYIFHCEIFSFNGWGHEKIRKILLHHHLNRQAFHGIHYYDLVPTHIFIHTHNSSLVKGSMFLEYLIDPSLPIPLFCDWRLRFFLNYHCQI